LFVLGISLSGFSRLSRICVFENARANPTDVNAFSQGVFGLKMSEICCQKTLGICFIYWYNAPDAKRYSIKK